MGASSPIGRWETIDGAAAKIDRVNRNRAQERDKKRRRVKESDGEKEGRDRRNG